MKLELPCNTVQNIRMHYSGNGEGPVHGHATGQARGRMLQTFMPHEDLTCSDKCKGERET